VTADVQNAGKARRGRSWVSKQGNLFASLLLINSGKMQDYSTLPFVASLAVYEAIIQCVSQITSFAELPVQIKWPNDVLFAGKKISGILLESTVLPNAGHAVVIGCGINCKNFPQNPLYPATSLMDEGYSIEPEMLFEALCDAMHRNLSIWNNGQGFAAIRQAWIDKAAGIGEQITARFEDHSETGRFVDINPQGRLILATDSGDKLISAADIFFGIQRIDGNTGPVDN
jgi:BirA family biotin operon repressor/biotin-[acetyl-CoA-carboxylase] ligase